MNQLLSIVMVNDGESIKMVQLLECTQIEQVLCISFATDDREFRETGSPLCRVSGPQIEIFSLNDETT